MLQHERAGVKTSAFFFARRCDLIADMWNRVYFVLLAIACVVTGFFIYYTASWLGSIGSPRDAFDGFIYHSRLAEASLWISTLILLIAANVVLWTYRRAWALWTTLLFLVIFVFARYAWLDNAGLAFAREHSIDAGQLRWGFLMSLITSVASAALIYFDVFLVTRLRDRLHGPSATPEKEESDLPSDQPPVEE